MKKDCVAPSNSLTVIRPVLAQKLTPCLSVDTTVQPCGNSNHLSASCGLSLSRKLTCDDLRINLPAPSAKLQTSCVMDVHDYTVVRCPLRTLRRSRTILSFWLSSSACSCEENFKAASSLGKIPEKLSGATTIGNLNSCTDETLDSRRDALCSRVA